MANCLLALAVIFWFWQLSKEHRWKEAFSGWETFLFGLFVLLLVLSALFSLHPAPSLYALKGVFTFLLFPLFVSAMEKKEDVFCVAGALGFAAFVLALIGVWQFLHGSDTLHHRIEATLSHYMTFSGILLLVCLLALGYALEGKKWRWGALALAALLACTLLLTFTRNAYVGFFVALIVYLALRRRKWLVAVPALAVVVYLLSSAPIERRLLSTFNPGDPTNHDRIDMVIAGSRMVADYPVFGLGLTLVKPYYPLYRVPDSIRWRVPHLHDNIVQIAAESGVFAALAYIAIIATAIVFCWKRLNAETDPSLRGLLAGVFLALVGITAAGFFEYNFGDVEVLMTTLVIMAIPFSRALRGDGGAT